jgi:exonuclease III
VAQIALTDVASTADIFLIQEIKVDKGDETRYPKLPGYNTLALPRTNKGGGICILVKNIWRFGVVSAISSDGSEHQAIVLCPADLPSNGDPPTGLGRNGQRVSPQGVH